ncbi:DUF393 domain-containing protein [Rhizobium leguminosarum]|uniref:DUF393 domain-containing protein n=1 Tax=Rhizobium leguminosarum TaxID=384 RepID=A0A6P0DHR3_RHILE|nr:DCC1-like thiol-disulfide oxidoreductase family protein [Rhizobium leguminosarum]NEK52538.1 DUF393 domain-containing protein [Rhizobium leguminosarum]
MSTFDVSTNDKSAFHLSSAGRRLVLLSVFYAFTLLMCSAFETEGYITRFSALFGSLAVIIIAVRYGPAERVYERLNSFSAFLERRGAFISNPVNEAPKFALLRMGFGLVMIYRAYWLLYYLTPSDWSDYRVFVPAFVSIVGGLMVAFGLFTQLALVVLIVFQWQVGDTSLRTSTLGNDIAALFGLLLIFANAGAHFSVDGRLRRRPHRFGRLIAAGYYRNGLAPTATLQAAKFLALLGYGAVCLYSLGMHLGEPAWMQGYAGPQLLTNNFMSIFGDEFTQLFTYSSVFVMLARVALWGMLPWYLLVVACVVWGGWPRTYALIWAFLFFCLSKFVLSLGMLAEFEFLFFAGLFWQRAFISGAKTLNVAYDDRCNLCDRTVNFIKATDIFNRVQLRPLSKNTKWLTAHGIDPSEAQKDLYGIDASNEMVATKGYDFYLLLTKKVALLIPFYPILLAASFVGGRAIYRFIADRRTKLFGVCHLPTPKKDYVLLPEGQTVEAKISFRDPITPFFLHVAFLTICYVTTIPTPWIFLSAPKLIQSSLSVLAPFGDAAHVYGITPINVFNHYDLGLAENWFTLSKIDSDGKASLLPVLDEHGKRLAAHRSDRNYFGGTLTFRRSVIDTTGCQYDSHAEIINYLAESAGGHRGNYIYRQYHQTLPDASKLISGIYEVQPISVVCDINFALK